MVRSEEGKEPALHSSEDNFFASQRLDIFVTSQRGNIFALCRCALPGNICLLSLWTNKWMKYTKLNTFYDYSYFSTISPQPQWSLISSSIAIWQSDATFERRSEKGIEWRRNSLHSYEKRKREREKRNSSRVTSVSSKFLFFILNANYLSTKNVPRSLTYCFRQYINYSA